MTTYRLSVKTPQTPAVRPDRFAWTDEEAVSIFGESSQKKYNPGQPRYPKGHSQGGQWADTGGGHVSVLSSEMVAGLPTEVTQPVNTWDELNAMAQTGQWQLRGALQSVADRLGLRTDLFKPKQMTPKDIASEDGFLFMGRLKAFDRASAKAEGEYGGRYDKVLDIVRATIAVKSVDDVRRAVDAMYDSGIKFAKVPKNRFDKPTDMGYRDLLGIVKLPNGMMAEVQFHVKAMTAAKTVGHKDYVVTTELRRKYKTDGPTATWSSANVQTYGSAQRRQKEIYDRAWEIATGDGGK